MSAAKIIVDCEQSLLSDPFFYLPMLARFVEARTKNFLRSSSIAHIFYRQYRAKTLTLPLLQFFLETYQHELFQWMNTQAENSPPFTAIIRVKDPALLRYIQTLYKQTGEPITIVTSSPYIQLLHDCLIRILPQVSFIVQYAPPVDKIKTSVNTSEIFAITPATQTPPSGYSLVINSTRPEPEGGWQRYAAELEQRLLNTGYFYDLRKEKELREKELKEQQLKEQPLREKEQNEDAPDSIQEEWAIYCRGRSYSPSFFDPAASLSGKNSSSIESPTVQRVKKKHSCSPLHPGSPLLIASPLRPTSPAQHIPTNMGAFKRSG